MKQFYTHDACVWREKENTSDRCELKVLKPSLWAFEIFFSPTLINVSSIIANQLSWMIIRLKDIKRSTWNAEKIVTGIKKVLWTIIITRNNNNNFLKWKTETKYYVKTVAKAQEAKIIHVGKFEVLWVFVNSHCAGVMTQLLRNVREVAHEKRQNKILSGRSTPPLDHGVLAIEFLKGQVDGSHFVG